MHWIKNIYYKSVNFFCLRFRVNFYFDNNFGVSAHLLTRSLKHDVWEFVIVWLTQRSTTVLTFVFLSLRRRNEILVYTAWGWCRCVRDLPETIVVPDHLLRLARTKRCKTTGKTTPEICTLRTGSRRFKSKSVLVWVNRNILSYSYDISNLETLIEYACDNVSNSTIKPIF